MDEPDTQMSGTAEGLIAFLEWASRTGELSSNTAAAYKTAVTKVLEIDGEAWRETVVRDLDVDRQLDRFTRLRASRYNADSLQTYGNRFKAAVNHYSRYLDNPASFRVAGPRTVKPAGGEKSPRSTGSSAARRSAGATTPSSSTDPAPAHDPRGAADLVQYPFPLRAGLMAYLSLPRDLRRQEAERIAAFVASLAIDPRPELGTGGPAAP